MPVPNWVPLLAKIGALFAVVLAFMAVGVLAGDRLSAVAAATRTSSSGCTCAASADRFGAVRADGGRSRSSCRSSATRSSSATCCSSWCSIAADRAVERASRAQPLHLCRRAGADVLGHERLRPLAASRGPGSRRYWTLFAAMLLVLAAAFWVRGTAPALARALASGAAQRCAVRKARCWRAARGRVRRDRLLDLLQHQRPQRVPARRTSCWIARRTTRRSTASTRTCRSRASSTSTPTSTSIPQSGASRFAGATGSSTSTPSRSASCTSTC